MTNPSSLSHEIASALEKSERLGLKAYVDRSELWVVFHANEDLLRRALEALTQQERICKCGDHVKATYYCLGCDAEVPALPSSGSEGHE